MDSVMNNPVKTRLLKLAICGMALGWGVASASADAHRYLYELSTKSGESLYAGEVPAGAKSPTKCVDVTVDSLGRVTQVVRQVNGKMTSETIYRFDADAKLPAGFATIAANGETISKNQIQRNDHGDRIRIDEFTVTGELAEYLIRTIDSDHVEEIYYTAPGNPKDNRMVRYYSPTGILVRSRLYVNETVYYEYVYDASNGLAQSQSKFNQGELESFAKFTYDDFGQTLRRDIYHRHGQWYGVNEYAGDLLMLKKYKFHGGANEELRYSYDDKRQPKELALYRNEQFVCFLKYDRFSTGAIKRTFALGAKGQVFAVYPGVEVDMVDRQGHAINQPNPGAIYREGDWWGPPMPSFDRADGDGAMP